MSDIDKAPPQYNNEEAYAWMAGRESAIDEIARLSALLAKAEREIEVLRQYGNKICTDMADDALRSERATVVRGESR